MSTRPWGRDSDRPPRETPWHLDYEPPNTLNDNMPWSPYQALMEAQPGHEPAMDKMTMLSFRDTIADAIDNLDEHHRMVFEQVAIGRMSYRKLEAETGQSRTTLHRWYHEAVNQLAAELSTHPAVRVWLGLPPEDEDDESDHMG